MTYLPGCAHCARQRDIDRAMALHPASGSTDTQREEGVLRTIDSRGRGGETSASGPSASPTSLPTCIAGCGRSVPVHGETCDWCWDGEGDCA